MQSLRDGDTYSMPDSAPRPVAVHPGSRLEEAAAGWCKAAAIRPHAPACTTEPELNARSKLWGGKVSIMAAPHSVAAPDTHATHLELARVDDDVFAAAAAAAAQRPHRTHRDVRERGGACWRQRLRKAELCPTLLASRGRLPRLSGSRQQAKCTTPPQQRGDHGCRCALAAMEPPRCHSLSKGGHLHHQALWTGLEHA